MMSLLLIASGLLLQSSTSAEETDDLQLLALAPVPTVELEDSRGGETLVVKLNQNQLEAYSQGNQAIETTTGSNAIGGTAFNGLNGFSSVVQNTGNNVIIQDSTIINIELHATP